MMQFPYIPYIEIPDQLQIEKGDVLVIASDVTRLALQAIRKERKFDIDLFLDKLLNKISTEGTLLIPAYNFNLSSGQTFDVINTMPVTGALALAASNRNDFKRTWHPLHSFYVWGKFSDKLCALRNESSFGKESPFAFFKEYNSKMLFIGTDVAEALTYTHFIEEQEQVRYRKYTKINLKYIDKEGRQSGISIRLFRKKFGWTMQLDNLQRILQHIYTQQKTINGTHFSVLPLEKAYEIILKDIKDNQARNIARYDNKLYFRDFLKSMLGKFNIRLTTQDKINYAAGLRR